MTILSWSGGKDSTASLILAKENGIKIDKIIMSEVMFSHAENISNELPEHIDWVYNVAIPQFEKWGYEVEVLKSNHDYLSLFYQRRKRGKYKGKANGFVLGGLCKLNNECKMQPIRQYLKTIKESYTQIVGICIDEPIRLARLKGNTISLLAQHNYTQQDALDLCKKYNLLSPIYELGKNRRSGCWNCPNQSIESFATLKQAYPHLWDRLKEMSKTENLCSQGFKWGKTFAQVEKEVDNIIYFRENQISMFKEYKNAKM